MKDENSTTADNQSSTLRIRWYHILATAIVAVLAIIAIGTIFRRFSLSLIGSNRTLQIAAHCDGEESENRYFGISQNELYAVSHDGEVRTTLNRDDAVLELLELGVSQVKVNVKEKGEWREESVNYGSRNTATVGETDECKFVIDYIFSR